MLVKQALTIIKQGGDNHGVVKNLHHFKCREKREIYGGWGRRKGDKDIVDVRARGTRCVNCVPIIGVQKYD